MQGRIGPDTAPPSTFDRVGQPELGAAIQRLQLQTAIGQISSPPASAFDKIIPEERARIRNGIGQTLDALARFTWTIAPIIPSGYQSLTKEGYDGQPLTKREHNISRGLFVFELATLGLGMVESAATKAACPEGKVIGLGLDRDLANHMGTGAITYENGGWQKAGLTKVKWMDAWASESSFMASFREAAQNARAIRFDVTSYDPLFGKPGYTQQELNQIRGTPSLLEKTTFFENNDKVIWNGTGFVKP